MTKFLNLNTKQLTGLGISVWALLSLTASFYYPGNLFVFSIACTSALLMVLLAWAKRKSYFYIYFSTILFLGFWLKAILHLIIGYDFVEPVGNFDALGATWDRVLLVSSSGFWGLILARGVDLLCFKKDNFKKAHETLKITPAFEFNRFWLWGLTLIGVSIIIITNAFLGIQRTGLVPLHHLPFKINVMISWLLATGIISWVLCLMAWSVSRNHKFLTTCYIFLALIATAISISVISRGNVLFQLLPILVSLYFLRNALNISYGKLSLYALIFLLSMAMTLALVTSQRNKLYSIQHGHTALQLALSLTTDRWLGLEGVMAVSSSPNLGIDLLLKGITEKQDVHKSPIYSAISDPEQKKYPDSYQGKKIFGSMPGIVGFLYYSGSWLIVLLGVFMVSCLTLFAEKITQASLKNPFILSFYSFYLTIIFSQMLTVHAVLLQIIEISMGIVILWIIQNKLSFKFNGITWNRDKLIHND